MILKTRDLLLAWIEVETGYYVSCWLRYINTLSTKLYLSDLKTHFVPRSKQSRFDFKNR